MKNLIPFCIVLLLAGWGTLSAQNMLLVTLDVSQFNNPDCWLNQGNVASNKVYIHSGLCVSNPQFCTDSIQGFGSPVWEHVTGNWGMDDGVGEMSYQGNGIWNLNIDLDTYYPAPNGSTPYTIGLVFRNFDGSFEGKDDQCADIFIKNVNGASPTVVQGSTNSPFPAVTATKVTSVQQPSLVSAMSISPNPSSGRIALRYELLKNAADFSAVVYNNMGQEVAELRNGSQQPGSHVLEWEGQASGLYHIVLRDGLQVLATEKVLIQK